jgi:hypothetical protein
MNGLGLGLRTFRLGALHLIRRSDKAKRCLKMSARLLLYLVEVSGPTAAHFPGLRESIVGESLLMAEMKSVANVGPEFFEDVSAYAGCQGRGTTLPSFGGTILARGFPCVGNKSGAVNADKSRDSGHLASAWSSRDKSADYGVFCAAPNAGLVRGLKAGVLAVSGGDAKSDSAGDNASAIG